MGGGVAQPQYLLYHKCNAVECVKATEQLTDLWTLPYREDRATHTNTQEEKIDLLHARSLLRRREKTTLLSSLLTTVYNSLLKLKKHTIQSRASSSTATQQPQTTSTPIHPPHHSNSRLKKLCARSLKICRNSTFSASNERERRSSELETEEKLAASGSSIFSQRVWHPPLTPALGLFDVLLSQMWINVKWKVNVFRHC